MSMDRKAVIKNADMPEDMQQDVIARRRLIARRKPSKNTILKRSRVRMNCQRPCSVHPQDIAAYIKKEFDKKYNPTWHCIVGRNFGSYVTHETKHFIYFYLGQVAILLFKSG
ncbi:hypothetical protein CTAYLR_010528 [Chrysophaeum taylorii]|uniref:Dynein light chain n=1 Tax=Chrysophaeum taylorii TaxID=2483200 RepID=A0AAD7XNQ2_9STRA|nr:hypothetical protein CTAYLR_010528 [Chrysophaeum taylorii]